MSGLSSVRFMMLKKEKKILTEVIGNHQEALERFLGFADEVNEIL